jgi:hypothetical protein
MNDSRTRTTSVAGEFRGVDLGDDRLSRRLAKVVEVLTAKPDVGFPRAFLENADLEGFYRMLRNEQVTVEAVLAAHIRATLRRIFGRVALVVHDSSEFRYQGTREELGRLGQSGRGFLGHFALCVTADGRRDPLGVLGFEAIFRDGESLTAKLKAGKISQRERSAMSGEEDRWGRLVDAAEAAASGDVDLIHLMDSEADNYKLLSKLVGESRRFVLRMAGDRKLAAECAPHQLTRELVAQAPALAEKRTVELAARRRHPGNDRKRTQVREARTATLAFSACSVVLKRPGNQGQHLPATLPLNIVRVRETDAPSGVEPMEWLLITTESIEADDDILRIVDFYRGRWVIEEFFKALKSGCAFEKRQLESRKTLLTALGVFTPIAWNLLRMRTLSRDPTELPARTVMTDEQMELMKRIALNKRYGVRWPEKPTAKDALLAVARLGGHLRSNGDPGWQVLGRGYEDFLIMEFGFMLAREM